MSETQNEYETDAKPTLGGEWEVDTPLIDDFHGPQNAAGVYSQDDMVAEVRGSADGVAAVDRARLIAAAGTAAQEAKDMMYDPVAAVQALPKLLKKAERIVDDSYENPCNPEQQSRTPPSRALIDDLDDLLADIINGTDALNSAEGNEE